MRQFICIKHPKYNGLESPVLSCSTCCSLYVHAIKESKVNKISELKNEIDSTKSWIEKKRNDTAKLTRPNLL